MIVIALENIVNQGKIRRSWRHVVSLLLLLSHFVVIMTGTRRVDKLNLHSANIQIGIREKYSGCVHFVKRGQRRKPLRQSNFHGGGWTRGFCDISARFTIFTRNHLCSIVMCFAAILFYCGRHMNDNRFQTSASVV